VTQSRPKLEEEFRYIDISSIDRDTKQILDPKQLLGENAPSRARRVVSVSDVLVSMTRPNLNAVAMVPLELDGQIASTGLHVLRPVLIDARWLFYLVRSDDFISTMSTLAKGVVYPAIRSKYIRTYEIPLAPLNEQKRIADKLDTLVARIDACRARLEHVRVILKHFREAVLVSAVSGQLVRNLKDEIINPPLLPLSQVIDHLKTGPFGSALHKYDYVLNGVPVINPTHIINGRIVPSSNKTVSDSKAQELDKFRFLRGDIVLARRGIMGRCAVIGDKEEGWLCGSGSMIIRPNELVLPEFLHIFLSSLSTVNFLTSNAVGSTMTNLNQRILLKLSIPVPSITTQHKIVERVKALLTYAGHLEARLQKALVQVERLTPALLDKAFRGELVPQDPNDEPASVLLERIRAERAMQPDKPKRTRRTKRSKMTKNSVKKAILELPEDYFSFDELRHHLAGDYDKLKDIIFALLNETEPSMTQLFDETLKTIHFVRSNK
jgi:type I restriction enzyme S subunit